MTRRIRALNRGRVGVWWVTHRRDAIHAAQLMALVGLWLTASAFDYQDQLDAERTRRARAEAQLAAVAEQFGPPAPPTVFVVEARSPEELQRRLVEIGQDLDEWRWKAGHVK